MALVRCITEMGLGVDVHGWKRNRLMCYYSVAERCSFQSGNSKEGTHWDTSHKPH